MSARRAAAGTVVVVTFGATAVVVVVRESWSWSAAGSRPSAAGESRWSTVDDVG